MPEIRSKYAVEPYRTIVLEAADLGISEGQYVAILIEALLADNHYRDLLATRAMKTRVEAAQRRARGVLQRLDGQRKRGGLFGG